LIAGVSLKTVSILGTEIDIERPWIIGLGLGFGWGYWLLRYYQSFRWSGYANRQAYYEPELKTVMPSIVKKLAPKRDDYKNAFGKIDIAKEWADVREVIPADRYGECSVAAEYYVVARGSNDATNIGIKFKIGGKDFKRARKRAHVSMAMRTPYYTEYILPFVLAALPLVVGLYQLGKWGLEKQ
jgi:hypothetical protein